MQTRSPKLKVVKGILGMISLNRVDSVKICIYFGPTNQASNFIINQSRVVHMQSVVYMAFPTNYDNIQNSNTSTVKRTIPQQRTA